MSLSKTKRYYQAYKDDYAKSYSFITKSRLGTSHAFCMWCRTDISISHGGKRDIALHSETAKHKEAAKVMQSNKKIEASFFTSNDYSVINAECLFTAFIIEHNLPLNCSDHAGSLFKKMFPQDGIAKSYACARTKTSAIVREMSINETNGIVEILKNSPFSIATDGSNDVDTKLYPVVVSFFDPQCGEITCSLLAVSSLEGDATGINIGNYLLKVLESKNIPLSHCVSFSCDNARVMLGNKSGVASVLTKYQPKIQIMGCPCHLINLAAEKGAACLPFLIDEILVDIYYYLQKSSKRKDRLKVLQQFHETEIKKVLKHVSTRWLSVSKCLERIVQQWQPLVSFFKEEAMEKNDITPLSFYTIPSKSSIEMKKSGAKKPPQKLDGSEKKNSEGKKPPQKLDGSEKKNSEGKKPPQKLKRISQGSGGASKKQKMDISVTCSRAERLFYFLTSDLNKAYCLFLLYIVPTFEKANVKLQSAEPQIHVLRLQLLDLYREVLIKFVKPGVLKSSSDLLDVQYNDPSNQKNDDELLIGSSTLTAVEGLTTDDKEAFYESVRKYFATTCDYMRLKFPLHSELLKHAEVAQLSKFESASFSSVRYFLKMFPETFSQQEFVDALESEFCEFQILDIPENIKSENRIDAQWCAVGRIKSHSGELKFQKLSKVMLGILTIPHSNAECERVFSQVRKIKTEFRSSLATDTLEHLLIVKSRLKNKCYETKFENNFLKRAKSCCTSFVQKEKNS